MGHQLLRLQILQHFDVFKFVLHGYICNHVHSTNLIMYLLADACMHAAHHTSQYHSIVTIDDSSHVFMGCAGAGHFDILMGKKVEREVFPIIHDFLLQNDSPKPLARL